MHWEDLPVAIAPTEPVTPDGVWSGSATYDADGNPVLFYTAGNDAKVPNQATALAWPVPGGAESPLTRWRLEPEPVTVQEPDLSSPVGTPWFGQFRDPFVWKETAEDGKPIWYQLVGSGIVDGETKVGGTALVYTSRDLVHWEYQNPLFVGDAQTYPKTGQVWELPVLLPLGERRGVEKYVFVVNPWFDGYNENTAKNTYYWVGEWDRQKHTFVPDHEEPRLFDYGEHFTGPSGMVDPKGRSLLFTITQDGRSEDEHHDAGWAHSMGLPVELDAHPRRRRRPQAGGRAQAPAVREGRVPQERVGPRGPTGPSTGSTTGSATSWRSRRSCRSSPAPHPARRRTLGSRCDAAATALKARSSRSTAAGRRSTLDRNHSSLDPDTRKGISQGPFTIDADGKVTLHTYVDRSVVEAFVDDEKSMTTRIYPTLADSIGLHVVGDDERHGQVAGGLEPQGRLRARGACALRGALRHRPRHRGADQLPTSPRATSRAGVSSRAPHTATPTSPAPPTGDGAARSGRPTPGAATTAATCGASTKQVGDAATGRLRSETFTLGGDGQIDLLTAGGYDPDKLYVALVRADDGEVVAKVSGNVNETLRAQYKRRQIDASEHVGEELYLEIVDQATGGFGHLSVDDINVPVALNTTRTEGETR